jgi:hypothetical protein
MDEDLITKGLYWSRTWPTSIHNCVISEVPCYTRPIVELLKTKSSLQGDGVWVPSPYDGTDATCLVVTVVDQIQSFQ